MATLSLAFFKLVLGVKFNNVINIVCILLPILIIYAYSAYIIAKKLIQNHKR